MNGLSKSTLALLSLFAVAMALLEAVVVVYLRRLYYPENPLELFPLAFLDLYDPAAELAREVATVVMILTVACLAERRTVTHCFAAFVFVFGVWDLFYYIWLKVLIGWPRTWLEWDVLFLIPAVWLGPWICPAAIALLFVVWGSWVLTSNRRVVLAGRGLALFVAGAIVGILGFLQPAAAVWVDGGTEALLQYTPGEFWWWLFLTSYLMMAVGLASAARQPKSARRPKTADAAP